VYINENSTVIKKKNLTPFYVKLLMSLYLFLIYKIVKFKAIEKDKILSIFNIVVKYIFYYFIPEQHSC